jgi:MoaA/NifB/PqqE/SkfB family radical SAM enzyme
MACRYIEELRSLNRDERARFHVDTNATLLTEDYIDELVEAGVTDIGPDLKGFSVETFMKITVYRRGNLQKNTTKPPGMPSGIWQKTTATEFRGCWNTLQSGFDIG